MADVAILRYIKFMKGPYNLCAEEVIKILMTIIITNLFTVRKKRS